MRVAASVIIAVVTAASASPWGIAATVAGRAIIITLIPGLRLRLRRPMMVTGLAVVPWTRLLPPLLLRPVIVLPHLKRRPVNRPRMPLHDIDPDTTRVQDPFIFINGEIRPSILRRPMWHRRRPKNMHRQVSPVGNPRWQVHFLLVPRRSPLPVGPTMMRRSQHDEIVGSAETSHRNVKVHFLDALGVVHHEALELLAALTEGKVA